VAARQAITAGAERAVAAAASGAIRPVPVPGELAVEAEMRLSGAVELAAKVPGAERIGTCTVRYSAASPHAAMDVLIVWSALASQYLSR
jgi:D-aminopeptidase